MRFRSWIGLCLCLSVALITSILNGCAVTPNPEAIGPYPLEYKDILKTYILRTYYDPYSIRSASVSLPMEGQIFFQQGYVVCLEANAKNRMGGYVGLKRTAYLINRGAVVQTMENLPWCEKASLFPWPEIEQMK